MSPLYAGIGGVVRELTEMYTGVGGVVKPMTEMWAGVGGVQRQIFSAGPEMVNVQVADVSSFLSDITVSYVDENGTIQTTTALPANFYTPKNSIVAISAWGKVMAYTIAAVDMNTHTTIRPYYTASMSNVVGTIAVLADADKDLYVSE